MTIEQVDRETAAAARKAAVTFYRLADEALERGDVDECTKQTANGRWHLEFAERLESKYDDEE